MIDALQVHKAMNDNNTTERWNNLVGDGSYPPIACILSKVNTFTDDVVKELVKWIKDRLSIRHVIPMKTFQVLLLPERKAYLEAEVMSPLRKTYDLEWKKIKYY